MSFLQIERPFNAPSDYEAYLKHFIEEGDKFNGVNIWLGNLFQKDDHDEEGQQVSHDITVFAHNQECNVLPRYNVFATDTHTHSHGNGRCGETWHKQKLGTALLDQAFLMAEKEGIESDICPVQYLKSLMFKVAANTYKPVDPDEWHNIEDTSEEERKNNSSIFLDVHLGETSSGLTHFATVSSTVIILTDDNKMYFWERIYTHSVKEPLIREVSASEVDLSTKLSKAVPFLDPTAHFTAVPYEEKLI